MLWDVMVAAAFVVVSVAVLVCFVFNSILTWLKKSHQAGPRQRRAASLLNPRLRQLTQSNQGDRLDKKLRSRKKLAAELAKLETEHGHEWRGMLQEQFARLWLRLNVPDEKPAKEPLKLPKIRGDGGKVA